MQKRASVSKQQDNVTYIDTTPHPPTHPDPSTTLIQALASEPLARLSEFELLQLILQEQETPDIARQLYRRFATLREMEHAGLGELMEIERMTLCKAAALQAAFALGRKIACKPLYRGQTFVSSRDVYLAYAPKLNILEQETFWILLLDQRNRVLKQQQVSQGSINRCTITPREIFTPALREKAVGMILLHNHPSGDPEPSTHDRKLTTQLREVSVLLGIKILDHIVVGDQSYVSFADRGWL
ncbi:MAG TPA: hypothetical protein DCE42_20330 [Myxococcales bacterium]|nr:hypothetical protein [Deltaproteobacteria bacterium]MBU48914.1 hypothetical protein [Deltaproteobacteria bacterium]HAA57124.1 hypothetical protein [Myxococcales bacterium]|tara:strand:+ start:8787 stop:9512 length:726 start_codon:yes stop_codon:yes gene_type:complete